MHPALIPARAALLVLERGLRGAPEAGLAVDAAAALLHLLLRLDTHLPNAGDFGGRRLGVLSGGAASLPADAGEEGGGAGAARPAGAAVGAEAAAAEEVGGSSGAAGAEGAEE